MRKINTLLTSLALAGLAFGARAGEMAPATTIEVYGSVMDGALTDYAGTMILSWNSQDIEFTGDPAASAELTYPNGSTTTISGEYSVRLGYPYSYDTTDALTISLGYLTDAGKYTLSIPAGIVKNAAGDTNPAQTFSFTIVGTLYSYYMTVTPPQSKSDYDYETGNNTLAPFYLSSELTDVSVTWDGYTLEPGEGGTVTASMNYGDDIDISDKVSVKDGAIKLDLSSLADGTWLIEIPDGYAKGTDSNGALSINGSLTLTFTILNNPSPIGDYSVSNPRAGSYYVDYLNYIQMSFDSPVKMAENAPAVTFTCGNETKNATATYVSTSYSGEYELNINLAEGRFDNLETPGLYTINIPAGVVTNGKYSNEAITLEYFIVETDTDYTTTPADKSSVASADFNGIKVVFPNATSIEANTRNWQSINVRGGEYGNYIYEYNLDMDNGVSISGNTITIALPEVHQVGYWVSIPGKDFIIDGTSTNDYINIEFTVWDGLAPATVLEGPAENATVSSDLQILLTWGYQTVTATDSFAVKLFEDGYDSDEIPVSAESYKLQPIANPEGGQGTALYIDLSAALSDYLSNEDNYGDYYFKAVVPAGIVKDAEGKANPTLEFKFKAYLVSPSELVMTAYPELENVYYIVMEDQSWMSGLNYYDNIYVTNRKGAVINFEEAYSYDAASIPDTGYSKLYIETDEYSGNAIVVNLNGLEDDRYVLTVPAGFAQYNLKSTGSYPDFTNRKTNFDVTVGEPAPLIFIGEVEYTFNEDRSADFTVPVTSDMLAADAVITGYYKLGDAAEYTAATVADGAFSFTLENLDYSTTYTVSVYAASGEVKSDVVTVEFETSEAPEPTIEILSSVVNSITSTSASIVVAYNVENMPEGGKVFVSAEQSNQKVGTYATDGTATLDITDLMGGTEYTFTLEAVIETATGDVIASAETRKVTFKTLEESGIEVVGAEGSDARYFTLDGVEIANPQPGKLVIKVEGNKVSKEIVR